MSLALSTPPSHSQTSSEYDCLSHECDTKNDHQFVFWMHSLPPKLKVSLSSHILDNIPERSRRDKTAVITSLSSSLISSITTRLLEQVENSNIPLDLRREAFFSLKIVTDVHTNVILTNNLLPALFRQSLNIGDKDETALEGPQSLSILDICHSSPVIEALDFLHYLAHRFPVDLIIDQLRESLSSHIKSTNPVRRFYGLMTFLVCTGPCLEFLPPLAINLLDELIKSYHIRCPLVDFALSLLISSWRCRKPLFQECISRRASLLPMLIPSITRDMPNRDESAYTSSAISCLGLKSILEMTPNPATYVIQIVEGLLPLIQDILLDNNSQTPELIPLPITCLAQAVISGGAFFAPYLKATVEILKRVSSQIHLTCEPVYGAVSELLGRCVRKFGGKFWPYHAFAVEEILRLGNGPHIYPMVKSFEILKDLTLACKGAMGPYLNRLVAMHMDIIMFIGPNVQSTKEYCEDILKKRYAIASLNHLASFGSILCKFVGAACRLNMWLLGHTDIHIRDEACKCLLGQVLWDDLTKYGTSRINGELRRHIAYYIRRLEQGVYISPKMRVSLAAEFRRALVILGDTPMPSVKFHPTSYTPSY